MRSGSNLSPLGIVLIGFMFMSGCGGDDGHVGITIQVDVSPKSATVDLGGTLQITAVVIEGSSSEVEWYVDDILGGNVTVGTVTQANPTTYSAPAVLPDPVTVVVKAVSTEDTTKFDTCTITIADEIVVDVSPGAVTVGTSGTFNISADVTGGSTNDVQWYVNDILNGNVIIGTVTQTNPTVYTAPNSVPSPATVVVKALSTEDASRYDTCLVTITEPPDISVELSLERQSVEVSEAFSITATVTGGTTNEVQWYVNSVLGGDPALGTITQTNPATYTAPEEIPDPDSVRVVAVCLEDASKSDTCMVTIVMSAIYVDASTGDDVTGTGSAANPVKSITRGLELAGAGEAVLVAPGVYDEANGEQFPIWIRGEALVGENWETCIIRGHSETEGSYSCLFLQESGSTVRKFTIEEGPVTVNGWDIATHVSDNSTGALLDSIRCFERAYCAVIRVDGALNTTIQNCLFDVRSISEVDRGFNRGLEIVFDDQGTILRNCTIRGFHNGGSGTAVFFNLSSDALVENCTVQDNGWGFHLCCCADPASNPAPDFGGGARGSGGGNTIRDNDTCGLLSCSTNDIYAKGNIWNSETPTEGVDYCVAETGDIIILE